ncbi:hypothetical protein COU87_03290 [Candidatus Roizmanbacteria bacterium CG10_big_fil_rev_8_21_14_0_10_39_12]|uniref:Uncharacterized protein n=1 Tax=Candidatus Roizmanbacteria bacterium CG10_big_fil_rev_8_21_14_0_10_39_12 TaxID=1974852 RepID=A0A2M8KP37_9BACT|nr:MAG: hypothetical protein COU87_03290 [Candidatus Roizmanbacteria bacterium CG10_big_fil_rev_8_21_14_0_10_39_12]
MAYSKIILISSLEIPPYSNNLAQIFSYGIKIWMTFTAKSQREICRELKAYPCYSNRLAFDIGTSI